MEITLETLHDNQEALRELVSSVLTLLNKEKGKIGRQKEEKDNQPTMPPIPNSVAAALLRISTRQLQRIRKQYNLKWLKRGREVLYFLGPLIEAINVYHLPWDPVVFDKIRTNYKNRPCL